MFASMKNRRGIHLFLIASFLVTAIGCGKPAGFPDLGEVNGTIKVDGIPTENLAVMFVPETGRPSMGVTDKKGVYRLAYFKGEFGAVVGEHKISILIDPDSNEEKPFKKIPEKYNTKTRLTRIVNAGSNRIDFDLQTSGKK